MNPRQQILQILFESNVLDGNQSRLAVRLGYSSKSRSTIERVRNNESVLKDKKLDELYKKISEEFLISDEEIKTVAQTVAFGKELYNRLREAYGVDGNLHTAAFSAIVTEDYPAIPRIDEELITELKELKLQEPELYFGMLAHFYIVYKRIDPYTVKGKKQLATQLNSLNELLHELYPGSNRSYESTKDSIRVSIADESLTILKLIYSLRNIIRGYMDNEYFENFLRETGVLLDVGEESFWIAPGETFHEGCTLWYLAVIPTKSKLRGAYMAMKLQAKSKANDSFELVAAYNVMFIIDENYDNIHIFQAYELRTGIIEYAEFRYDEDTRLLELNFEDTPQRTFNLPEQLRCINHTAPTGKDEKIWANIVNRLLTEKGYKYILEAANSYNNSDVEYLAEYDVTNVQVDRNTVTVTIEFPEGERMFAIDINAYSFMKQLTPTEFASVVRLKSNGELAVCWNYLGQSVPLKSFTEKI